MGFSAGRRRAVGCCRSRAASFTHRSPRPLRSDLDGRALKGGG